MRIRSIKPEFWRSDDIDSLDWHTRLLFIGLWSYVDDNGVGRDKVANVAADIFAGDLSVDPTETLRRVSLGLDALHQGGQIERYQVDGRPYLHIVAWERHQLVKNPNKARYPLPTCGNAIPTETLRRPSVDPTETLPPGTEEQRNRGTGDSAKAGSAVARRQPATTDASPTAQTIIAEHVDHCRARPPSNVLGQLAKHVAAMLAEGIDPDHIRAGLAAFRAKPMHPSTLPSLVNEAINAPAPRELVSRRQSETDAMFARAMERAQAREAQQ